MRNAFITLVLVCFLANIDSVSSDEVKCELFLHHNFAGESLKMTSGQCIPYFGLYNFNDAASSVKVANGCTLVTFEDANYQGCAKAYSQDKAAFLTRKELTRICSATLSDFYDSNSTNKKENDNASSAKCYCGGNFLKTGENGCDIWRPEPVVEVKTCTPDGDFETLKFPCCSGVASQTGVCQASSGMHESNKSNTHPK